MYKSPIEVIYGQMQTNLDGDVIRAVQKYGITVDKDELIKALAYDRGQYEAGWRDAMASIVRCKECIHFYESDPVCLKIYSDGNVSSDAWQTRKPDDYCSYGERKGGSDDND